jgi:hypothetical protein
MKSLCPLSLAVAHRLVREALFRNIEYSLRTGFIVAQNLMVCVTIIRELLINSALVTTKRELVLKWKIENLCGHINLYLT